MITISAFYKVSPWKLRGVSVETLSFACIFPGYCPDFLYLRVGKRQAITGEYARRTGRYHGDTTASVRSLYREDLPQVGQMQSPKEPGGAVQKTALEGDVVVVDGFDSAVGEEGAETGEGFGVFVAGDAEEGDNHEVADFQVVDIDTDSMVGVGGVLVAAEEGDVLVCQGVPGEGFGEGLRPVFVFGGAVVAEEGAGVDEAHHAVGVAGHVIAQGGDDDDFGFEEAGKLGEEVIAVTVGVLAEDAVGDDGAPAAEEDVAAVEVDGGEGVGGDAVEAADFGGVGAGLLPCGVALEVGGFVAELDEPAGSGPDGHVVTAPDVARSLEETVRDAVAVEDVREAAASVGKAFRQKGGEADDGVFPRGLRRVRLPCRGGSHGRGGRVGGRGDDGSDGSSCGGRGGKDGSRGKRRRDVPPRRGGRAGGSGRHGGFRGGRCRGGIEGSGRCMGFEDGGSGGSRRGGKSGGNRGSSRSGSAGGGRGGRGGGSRGGLCVVAVADDGRVHGQEHFAQFRGRLQAVLQAEVFKHGFLAALTEGEVGNISAF